MASKKTAAAKAKGRQAPLNHRQERFVEEYLIDFNATQAAIRAGYSAKTAGQLGERLLKNVQIAQKVDQRREQQAKSADLSAERVLKEAMRLAFFDIRKLVHPDGTPKKLSELDDDTAAAIQGLDVASIGNAEVGLGTVLKYKIADKNSAIERLFKHLGLFKKDNEQSNPGDALASLLGKISSTGSRLPVVPKGSKA
jgi:phage terminase small subunit